MLTVVYVAQHPEKGFATESTKWDMGGGEALPDLGLSVLISHIIFSEDEADLMRAATRQPARPGVNFRVVGDASCREHLASLRAHLRDVKAPTTEQVGDMIRDLFSRL